MNYCKTVTLALTCAFLGGCVSTRSISNSGYERGGSYHGDKHSDPAFTYRGELSEFDVLGIDRGKIASEGAIQRALDNSRHVKLKPDSSILLIQSGAVMPDGAMVTELSRH